MAMEVLPTILMVAVATHTGVLRVFMVGMDIMDMVRDLLRLNLDMAMVMDMVLLLSMSPRLTMDMDTTLPSTPMDTILDMDMARDPLSQVARDDLTSITRYYGKRSPEAGNKRRRYFLGQSIRYYKPYGKRSADAGRKRHPQRNYHGTALPTQYYGDTIR